MQHSTLSCLRKLPCTDTPQPGVCSGGTSYKKGKYFGHKNREITGHRKMLQKIL